jgi:hypothetical protein
VSATSTTEGYDSFFWPSVGIILLVFFGSVLAEELGGAAIVLAFVWVPAVAYVFLRAPPHLGARLLFLLALFLEPPDEKAGAGYWVSPLKPASDAYFAGMQRMGFTGISLPLVFFLSLALLFRASRGRKPKGYVAPPRQAVTTFVWFLGALLVLEAYGMIGGGSVKPSFWQLHHMLHLGVIGLTFLYAFRGPRDLRAIGTTVVVAAVAKGLLVFWVYEIVCRPLNVKPTYATTHSDSVLFGAALLVLGVDLLEHREKKRLLRLIYVGLFIVVSIVMNNRRLAFVGVAAGALAIFSALKTSPLKRKASKVGLVLAAVVSLYVWVGGHSKATVFAPAVLITSVIEQKDSSSESREIENYNLIATLKKHPILGPGFGHEYIEFVRAEDISEAFPMYKYIAHNSVLWLWSFGGLLGFAGLWMVHAVAALFAARGYRLAETPLERSAGLTALAVILVCMLQEWGDMGICAFSPTILLAASYAVGAKLCGARMLAPRRA